MPTPGRNYEEREINRLVEVENFPADFRDGNSRLYVWGCSETVCQDDDDNDNGQEA
jgi:hypothetical protein